MSTRAAIDRWFKAARRDTHFLRRDPVGENMAPSIISFLTEQGYESADQPLDEQDTPLTAADIETIMAVGYMLAMQGGPHNWEGPIQRWWTP